MTDIALFHSVLGVRPGVVAAAQRLRKAGHHVHVIDQYDGRVFTDYVEADRFAQEIGYPVLMDAAARAVSALPDGFIAAGFSNGGGMAEFVATQRRVGGVLMLSGTLPLSMLGASSWPTDTPAQIHYTAQDPFRQQAWIDDVADSIRASGSVVDVFDYPGSGHLFTDASLREEFQAADAEQLWKRVLAFAPLRPSAP